MRRAIRKQLDEHPVWKTAKTLSWFGANATEDNPSLIHSSDESYRPSAFLIDNC